MVSNRLPFHPGVVATTLATVLSCALAHASGGLYEVREVKPQIYVWLPEDIRDQDGDPQFSRAANAGFVVSQEAVVVVNTTNTPEHARELLYEIRNRTEAPVKYVINTDSSADENLGNEVFTFFQPSYVSTSATRQQIGQYQRDLDQRLPDDWKLQARMRGVHITMPNQTFDGRMELGVGGEVISLRNLRLGDNDGSAAVYLPKAKLAFLGSALENEFFPRIGARDVRRWIRALRELEQWDVDMYIPGHGPPGGKKEVAQFRQFLEWLANEVTTRIKEGKSLEQTKRELGSLENYHWHAPELVPADVEAVYGQMAAGVRGSSLTGER